MDNRDIVPLRMHHQIWLSCGLLLAPCFSSLFFYWFTDRLQPSVFLALLPGLAVAVYIQGQLAHHSGLNHPRGEADRLFPTLGGANWITLLRAGAIVGLADFLPLAILRGQGLPNVLAWAPGIIYLGVSLADLLDGFIARKHGRETELGKHLDIETDAAGLLTASLVAFALGRLPAIYLLAGIAYYPYILGIRVRQKRGLPVIALRSRPYARIIAGFQMGLVGMALLPMVNPAFTFVAAYIFMTPLLIGFLRDWLVVSGRVKTDADQQSILDHWARSAIMKILPLALRLVMLAAGISAFVGSGINQTHLAWRLAPGFCCLLAGFGFMGRSAALCLVLMLCSNPFPFNTPMISMLLFCTAATLMLTGTGGMSLWAPEERILYRRKNNRLRANCEMP
jgi:CDP-diacylglycerol---glycerol-3-phosphate 3-phosphatidyltransferase